MKKKIIIFVTLLYFLTFLSAFVIAEQIEPTEDLGNLQEELEKARQGKPEQAQETPEEAAITPEPQTTSSSESNKVILEEPPAAETPQEWALTFMGGTYRPNKYQGHGEKFSTIYTGNNRFLKDQGLWVDLSFEWQVLKSFGRLGPKFSTGSWFITREHDATGDTSTTKTMYTLWALPVFLGGIYRMHYWPKQPLVPFVEAAYGGFRFQQGNADTNDRYRDILRTAILYGGGLQLNANILDPRSARSFDINWGVNNTYLVAEYRFVKSTQTDAFDFSGESLITGGLLFEF